MTMALRLLATLLCCLLFVGCRPGLAAEPIRIGVLAYRGGDHSNALWGPTIAYLAERFQDRGAEMVPLDLEGVERAVRGHAIDFVLTNTGNYVDLESRYGISRIATLHSLRSGSGGGAVGSAIFTLAGRKELERIADIRGHSVLAVDPEAFGGFQIAWGEMLAAGVDPFRDAKALDFSGFPVDAIAHAVLAGKADVGVMRACLLEEMAAEGHLDLTRIKIMGARPVPGFSCALSTPLYPDWPLARLAGTPESLAKQVAVALFEIPPDHPAARAGGYDGWTVPLDYQSVHTLFRALRIGPYRHLRDASIGEIARQHWQVLAVAALILLWWAFHSLRVEHLIKARTAELRTANAELAREIAQRKRAEENARERQRDMDHVARLSILGEMSSNLAHELNQPLGAITNYARGCALRLEAGTGKADQILDAVRAIAAQAERAGRIIGRIRDFVQKRAPRPERIDINATVEAALVFCEPQALSEGIGLEMALTRPLPPVLADPVQIEQVVLNLVKNALDAMAGDTTVPGGRVVVRTRLDEAERVEVAIADSGTGLSDEARRHLFDPYFTTKSDGMGLGLSICRSIVESLGGHLWTADNPGGGLIVGFVLPAATEETPDAG